MAIDPLTNREQPGPVTFSGLDRFTRAYVECALWSSTDGYDYDEPVPMNQGRSLSDFAPETLGRMAEDCEDFLSVVREVSPSCLELIDSRPDQAGRDFWLTRNGHGCGFWDGDWPEPAGAILHAVCQEFGESNLYVGDDGRIYIH